MPRIITSEDFLSLPIALVQREAYFLLGCLDHVPEAQEALRTFYARVSSAAAGAREGADAFAAPLVPHDAPPSAEIGFEQNDGWIIATCLKCKIEFGRWEQAFSPIFDPGQAPWDSHKCKQLSPIALRAALHDLAADGIVHLDTETQAQQVYDAAGSYVRDDEFLTHAGTTVRLSRAS